MSFLSYLYDAKVESVNFLRLLFENKEKFLNCKTLILSCLINIVNYFISKYNAITFHMSLICTFSKFRFPGKILIFDQNQKIVMFRSATAKNKHLPN